jgi:hypothetical protein
MAHGLHTPRHGFGLSRFESLLQSLGFGLQSLKKPRVDQRNGGIIA